MSYTKTIVCLANSRKMSGRCLAGKEVDAGRRIGQWIRPVSERGTQEISEEERRYENGEDPRILDIVSITMREECGHGHQTENHLIDASHYWAKRGRMSWDEIRRAVDHVEGPLWVNGHNSYSGYNDRIPEAEAARLSSSLLLIEPEGLVICVAVEGAEFGTPKRRVRANFKYNNERYTIAVTDPIVERQYLAQNNGEYPIRTALLCVSIGEAYQGYCYKLVAAVITPERRGQD